MSKTFSILLELTRPKMLRFESPLDAFLHWESQTPDKIFLKQPIQGSSLNYSFRQAGEISRKMAAKLQSYGLPKGAHIALLSKNCAHWIMADVAIMMAGYVSIPIYPTLNAASIAQILEHSEAQVVIVGKLDAFEAQEPGLGNLPVISVNLYGETAGECWEDIVKTEAPLEVVHKPQFEAINTIIYTSGTTGAPKGVMHTVGNFMESTETLISLFQLPKHLRLFSYLPLAHVAERLIANAGIALGATTSFAESLDTFADDLEATQPHIFFAVPRIWSKFQEKILQRLPQKRLNFLVRLPVLGRVIKQKLKKRLGLKEAVFICSGAAPIAPSLVRWYRALDIVIYQGYGMTEDCCVSHFNLPGADKIGSVGKTLYNVEVKLSDVGEICVKNPCLMTGYYKAPHMTASVFTEDGFLRTGDIGEFDHDGFLTITGRVKDQFKTDKGKYISPGPLELECLKNPYIEQICIVGTGIPQPIALVTLSEQGQTITKQALATSLENEIKRINPAFEKHERLEKIVVMREDWTVDNGLLTPTLKVKRNQIEKIHQPYYQTWFNTFTTVIFEH